MIIRYLLFLFFLLMQFKGHSIRYLPLPKPNHYVHDFADIFSSHEEDRLEVKIRNFEKESSIEIAVVTVETLGPLSADEYALQLGNRWGVGKEKGDNGIVLLIKPKYSNERGQVYIAVGKGLEGAIPDMIAKRIVENVLIPSFKRNKMYDGVDAAITILIQSSAGEYNYAKIKEPSPFPDPFGWMMIFLVLIVLLPFSYIFFLKFYSVPEVLSPYYFDGNYKANSILQQIERLEEAFNKKFTKFKSSILKYNRASKGDLEKHSGLINKKLLCYMLNGDSRLSFFMKCSDPMLKSVLLAFLFVGVATAGYLAYYYYDMLVFFITLLVYVILIYMYMGFAISVFEMYIFVLRGKNKPVAAFSLAAVSMKALFERNMERRYDVASGTYYYYPNVIFSSGSSGGSFGGGYSGGGSFGGGSFGGGGAGGSW